MTEIAESAALTLSAGFEVIPVDAALVLVRSPERGVRVSVEGMGASELAATLRSLDGARTMRALRRHGSAFARLVRELVARDIVRVGVGAPPAPGHASYMARDHDDPTACLERLRASRVVVCGDVPFVRCVERDLTEIGVRKIAVVDGAARTRADGPSSEEERDAGETEVPGALDCRGADLIIACLASPRDALADRVSVAAGANAVAWLPLLVFGVTGIVGPLFVPNEGPCLQCLRSREAANWADPELTALYYETIARREVPVAALGGPPAFGALVSQWGVLEAAKYLARFTAPALLGALLRLDFPRLSAVTHRVLRLPRCRGCSVALRRPAVGGRLLAGAS